jgi:GTP cyclohydrolase I
MVNASKAIRAIRQALVALGIDVADGNFRDTPARVTRMLVEMFEGVYKQDEIGKIVEKSFPTRYKGLIVHDRITVFSLCPHHLLPVEYDVSIGYIAAKTIGLSKLPRLVELLAKRPVLQETLTEDIADTVEHFLQATAVMVVVRGRHSCMRVRGIKTRDVVTTSAIRGEMEKPEVRAECLSLMKERS